MAPTLFSWFALLLVRRRSLLLAAVLVISPTAMRAQADLPLFTDGLNGGWQNWSWATVNLAAATPVHGGARSIQVSITGSGQALALHHSATNSAPYQALTFWIHGGTAGGQNLRVGATINNVAQPTIALAAYLSGGAVVAGAWRQATVPLADLGAASQGLLTELRILDGAGAAQPAFYVDDVALAAAPVPATVHLSVDAANWLRSIDDRQFGLNSAVWDGDLSSATTASLLAAAGTRALRFPGGSLSDEYHWASNTTLNNAWTWATNFDQFATLATAINARTFITVNYGTGTPAEAASWVTYANVTKGYGFKYWEVGNECYGTWETDTQAVAHDPYTYATRFRDYLQQMKAADPTVRVGIVVITGEDQYANNTAHPATNPRTGQVHNGWTPVLLARLRSLGVTPDFAIYHRYDGAPAVESDAELLQSAQTWPQDAADLRQQLSDYLGAAGDAVELVVTENNSVYSDPGKQSTSLVNGLFLADSFGHLVLTEFNALMWWDIRNGQDATKNNSASLYGWRNYGDYGVLYGASGTYPTYYVHKLLQHFARGGDVVVPATSDYGLLTAFGARAGDGSLRLLVINKSPTATINASIALSGFLPAANATVRSYGVPQDDAARTGIGSPDIATATISSPAATFSHSFAPYSVTVLTLPPATPASSSAQLLNISARAHVGTGADVLIAGFAVSGSGSKHVLLRGIGPSLSTWLSSGLLADPQITLFNASSQVIATNDNWGGTQALTDAFAQTYAFMIPANSADTALLHDTPATTVTAHVAGVGGTSGIALAEVYDADNTSSPRLANISARANVGVGADILIGGFVIGGTGSKQVLIRAVGPSLANPPFNVPGVLADPLLRLFNGAGVEINRNDDWGGATALAATFTQVSAFALAGKTLDAALLVTLPPGSYTAQVSGVGGSTGIALVEIYEVQ